MKLSWLEGTVILALLGVVAALVLPLLSTSREASRRASCQNNLKQLGIVLKMYANESEHDVYPPLSADPANWMMDINAVYPDYLTDLSVLICPSSPLAFPEEFTLRRTDRHPGRKAGEMHPDCVTGKYYTYTGYSLTGDEPALALYLARHARPDVFRQMKDVRLPIPQWEKGNWQGRRSGMTLMWDRIPPDSKQLPHLKGIINVLCMDGSVRSVRYSSLNHAENFPVTEITALTFGQDIPTTDSDCF